MAKKKSKKSGSKKSKKSKKVESYEFELPGDGSLEIIKLFDFQEHGEKNASATALQLVQWNDSEPVYEKRGLYRKQKEADEAGEDITDMPWRIGKCKGMTEKELGKILNSKSSD